MPGPFYFAWVDPEEPTFGTFGPEHLVEDEVIQSAKMEHVEGASPMLSIVIRNPRVGLLSPGRKTWAWFSVDFSGSDAPEPIFFGQLVAIPTDLLGEVCTLVFIARAVDHEAQKQIVAEGLKIPPGYDPIFIDPAMQDDPDTVLEGYSMLWHVDRLLLEVTASDIIVGEDGIEIFTADEVPYESVSMPTVNTPLPDVHVDATVTWIQTGSGYVDVFGNGPASGTFLDPDYPDEAAPIPVGKRVFETYSGDGIIGDWPKVAAQLQSGYSVAAGTAAVDVRHIATAESVSWRWIYENKAKEHITGDTLKNEGSGSTPMGITPSGDASGVRTTLTSEIQPGFLDPYADPQINIPMRIAITYQFVPQWVVECTLVLRYDVALQRSERLKFTLSADLQEITTGGSEREIISITGVDVGLPLLNVLNWATVSGEEVALGQIIRALLYDGTVTYQIATTAGTAGDEQPVWTDILGDTTADGTVVWTSLGTELFSNDIPEWIAEDPTPLGQVIFTTPVYQLCTGAGTTGENDPDFNLVTGGTTVDGTVTWTCIGVSGAFIGTPIEDTTRGVFFPTDRGTRAIEYLLSVARAHLLMRARAINISFECSFERALALSCRKNAILYDPRLPGGEALGKIIAYSIEVDGPSGRMFGTVTIGCAIGRGGAVIDIIGEPDYVEEDVLGPEVQEFIGQMITLPSEDIVYERPMDTPTPDDLYFPLTAEQIIVSEEVHRGLPEQEAAIEEATLTAISTGSGGGIGGGSLVASSSGQDIASSQQERVRQTTQKMIRENSVWYELVLRPLAGGNPINNRYDIDVSTMTVPRTIDLEDSDS